MMSRYIKNVYVHFLIMSLSIAVMVIVVKYYGAWGLIPALPATILISAFMERFYSIDIVMKRKEKTDEEETVNT